MSIAWEDHTVAGSEDRPPSLAQLESIVILRRQARRIVRRLPRTAQEADWELSDLTTAAWLRKVGTR